MLKPWKTRVLQANLVAQTLIVFTGALVRVTSSGLGCPTWPECVPGSITPTSDQTEQWHKYVEFGNRLLTFVLVAVAIATIIAMRDQRKSLRLLSYGSMAGIFAQAILGGISVLTNLNPLIVAAHFLLSIGLIAVAQVLLWRSRETTDEVATLVVHPAIAHGVRVHTVLALAIITVGTLVTGSGPHAGDSADIERLPFDPRTISWFHADLVLLFIGLTIGLHIAMRATGAPDRAVKGTTGVLLASALQGLIGYSQYFLALPWGLVALHVLGSAILWIATLRLRMSIWTRP